MDTDTSEETGVADGEPPKSTEHSLEASESCPEPFTGVWYPAPPLLGDASTRAPAKGGTPTRRGGEHPFAHPTMDWELPRRAGGGPNKAGFTGPGEAARGKAGGVLGGTKRTPGLSRVWSQLHAKAIPDVMAATMSTHTTTSVVAPMIGVLRGSVGGKGENCIGQRSAGVLAPAYERPKREMSTRR